MKKEIPEEQWNKKRIIITLVFVVAAIFVAAELKSSFFPNSKSILGESSQITPAEKPNIKPPSLNVSEVGAKIDQIKNNINSLNANEVATSSPQIQKVLHDIQGIKDLPADKAKDACVKICSGL